MNTLPLKVAVCVGVMGVGAVAGVSYYLTPKYGKVGYMPSQPIPFSHKLHSGQLGLDCRYCHSFVEEAPHSNIPASQVCWNCHQHVKTDSPRLAALRKSIDKNYTDDDGNALYDGKPIEWVHIHRPPDYVYFSHAAHVNRGVSCVSCHGKVNEMSEVWHAEPHSMGWCLECHRNPEDALRPLDQVTNLDWKPSDLDRKEFYQHLMDNGADAAVIGEALGAGEGTDGLEALIAFAQSEFGEQVEQREVGTVLKKLWDVQAPSYTCAGCHR